MSEALRTVGGEGERRLAAIVFTDVVGYSARMQTDETGTMALVRSDFARMRELCVLHGGEVLKSMGDGLLLCFSSVVQSVACALQIQTEHGARDPSALQHRIGIHLGDVFRQDGDVAGDGVNIAARLETKARPGTICLSQSVYDAVKGKLPMQVQPLGQQQFKNIAEPLTVYLVAPTGTASPFAPISPVKTKRRGWLVGVALVGVAAMIATFFILSPARSGKPVEAAVVAASAPATKGGRLADQARELYLMVGFTREHLLAAENLAKQATDAESSSAAAWGVRAGVQAAWLMRGWDSSEKRLQDTQGFANQALALDPNEPEALIALGQVLIRQSAFEQAGLLARRGFKAHPEYLRLGALLATSLRLARHDVEAREVLTKVVSRDPRNPLFRYNLALTYCNYLAEAGIPFNRDAALTQLDAAIAVQPFATALLLKATLMGAWRGDWAGMRATLDQLDALPLAERAEDRSVAICMWAYLIEHRADRVAPVAALTSQNYLNDAVIPFSPKAWSLALAHRLSGQENLARNDWQSAVQLLREKVKAEPANTIYPVELAISLAWLGDNDEAQRLIDAVEPAWAEDFNDATGLLARDPFGRRLPLLARYYGARGDVAKGLPYLRRALDQNAFMTRRVVALDPWWDKFRGQPEFEALLKETEPAKTVALPIAEKSVAVLPFTNMSEDKDNAFFTDGIHEDILTNLANVGALKVISRTSVMQYRDTKKSIRQVGAELGTAYVLEGSIRRAGGKVRVTGQLIDARTDEHLWAKSYDRDLKDIFAIQSELAGEIAGALEAAISPSEQARIDAQPTGSIAAYELYLQARDITRGTINIREMIERAQPLMEKAVQLDPRFAHAWALLGNLHARIYVGLDQSEPQLVKAREAMRQAVEFAPDSAVVLRAEQQFYHLIGELEKMENVVSRISRLYPDRAETFAAQGSLAWSRSSWHEAVDCYRRALSLDPRNDENLQILQKIFLDLRRYSDAEDCYRRLGEIHPLSLTQNYQRAILPFLERGERGPVEQFVASLPAEERRVNPTVIAFEAHWLNTKGDAAGLIQLWRESGSNWSFSFFAGRFDRIIVALAFLKLGRREEAIPLLEKDRAELLAKLANEPRNPIRWCDLALVHALLDDKPSARQALEKSKALFAAGRVGPGDNSDLASVHAWMGEKDEAFAILATLLRQPRVAYYANVHQLQSGFDWWPLQDDPRLKALVADPLNNAPLF